MSKKIIAIWVCAALLFAVALIVGFTPAGPAVAAAPAGATAIESCVTCHPEAGVKHQASYDELYQDGVIKVADVAYSYAAPDKSTVTFKMTKNGAPFDARKVGSLAIYFTPYTGKSFQFEPAADRLSLKGDITCDGAGICTSVLAGKAPDVTNTPGLIVVYGGDEVVGQLPVRVQQTKYPFAALLKTGGGVNYVSAANNAGCEKCHTTPYLKHGYIYGEVNNDPTTDFYTCKACHLDNGTGGHFEWQLSVNDPPLAAKFLAEGDAAKLPPEQEAQYAYKTSLMNDVHMSHAMEFPYPQSMANCVTCHEGKLDTVLADANFKVSTCKSCHPVSGTKVMAENGKDVKYDTTKLALKTILPPAIHGALDLNTVDCTACHGAGKPAPAFRQIHTGYDKAIYTADGLRYSNAISVTIDSAAFAGNKLTIKFHAGEAPALDGITVAQITPTVLVGLYGWDTKDYIIGPHERLTDDNGDGKIDSTDQRTLEYVVGDKHPRVTTVSAAGGSWEVVADLSTWADLIANKSVKRVEIAVIPTLVDAQGVTLALNAPSRTFDLAANGFADGFYSPIVKVTDGCNNCHEALATTFHTADRGGNVVVCRLCHVTKSGGSHLEMQSRSIDSYVHAIHSGQAFDIGLVDFADPVAALRYKTHIELPYPMHGANCESCHIKGTYDVPDQSKSLPGLLSASAKITGWDRKIGAVPAYVTGPASRACGGCHRAEKINEDAAGKLISFNQHTKMGGYLIEAGDDANKTLGTVIDEIMAVFK